MRRLHKICVKYSPKIALSPPARYNENDSEPGGDPAAQRSVLKEVKRLPYEKKSLGEKLRKLRESYNLSQGQVAEALNIDRSTYTYYELDKTRPNLETLVKISRIFNVPTATLLPDDEGKQITFRDIARSDGLLRTLSKEERGLIVYYRSLNKEDQAKMLAEMAKLAKKPQ